MFLGTQIEIFLLELAEIYINSIKIRIVYDLSSGKQLPFPHTEGSPMRSLTHCAGALASSFYVFIMFYIHTAEYQMIA